MPEELKQAAQAALEALEEIALAGMSGTGQESEEGLRDWHARQAWKFIGIAARELEPLRRALAQRPAAQTERGAFEAFVRRQPGFAAHLLYRRNFPGSERIGQYVSMEIEFAWEAWQARASMPASQQATPERHLTVTTNQQGEAVMVSWQDDEHRILDVVWERKPATPEPVGEVVAYREKLTGRLCEPEHTHRRKFPMCYEPITRPAPGVPEDVQREIAAAQAKGGQ